MTIIPQTDPHQIGYLLQVRLRPNQLHLLRETAKREGVTPETLAARLVLKGLRDLEEP